MPVIMTHGWPGSIFELLNAIDPLTNPTAHGGRAEDAFDVVIPSMPGYGFSGKLTSTGWSPVRIALAWDTLMKRLGYTRYVAQGGDWGANVSEALARQAPEGLVGIPINLLLNIPPEIVRSIAAGEPPPAGLSETEKTAYGQRKALALAYLIEQSTRPQTIGYSLADSPVGLAAWMLDHDPHGYQHYINRSKGILRCALLRATEGPRVTRGTQGLTARPTAQYRTKLSSGCYWATVWRDSRARTANLRCAETPPRPARKRNVAAS